MRVWACIIAMAAPAHAADWANGLHKDLLPIAELESSGGKNVNHVPSAKGEYDTAVGALGLKPTTAFEQYARSPTLQARWPGLNALADFTTRLKSDFRFYNAVALDHFRWLKKVLGSAVLAVYGWRYGLTAALVAPHELIEADPYVVSYFWMAHRP